uniref:Pinin_SDK_memA domain-containing protein n=1 Tax=Parastrongyloides trichosuri TaxID=131310 RepID=A0A0N4ZYZ6_PARTI
MTDDIDKDLQEAQAELAKLTSKISAINKQKYPSYGKDRSTTTLKRKTLDFHTNDYDRFNKRRRSRGEGSDSKITWKDKVTELRSQETNDEKERKKRLFSSLLLPNLRPKNTSFETKLKQSAEKQKEKLDSIESSLNEKKECEIEDLQRQEKELHDKKKEAELLVNKLSLKKAIIEKAERKIVNLEGRIKFIQTKTVPKISFLPAKHTLRTTELLKKSSKNIKDEIEKISYITRYQVKRIEDSSLSTFKNIAKKIEDGTLVPESNENKQSTEKVSDKVSSMEIKKLKSPEEDKKENLKNIDNNSLNTSKEETSDDEDDSNDEKSADSKSSSENESEEDDMDTTDNIHDKCKNDNELDKCNTDNDLKSLANESSRFSL